MKTPLHILLYSLWLTSAFGLRVIHKWKYMDFEWESEKQKQQYLDENKYSADAVVPIDVHFGIETYIAIPRTPQVPAGLATLNMKKLAGGGPVLSPYPNWSWTNSECNKTIVSVYRMTSDKCGRLWVLDNGKVGETQKCPPKIVAFDQATRKLVKMKEIPNKYAFNRKGAGLLVTPLVKTFGRKCENLIMYIADIEGYGLIVWDGKDTFKRHDSEVFAAQRSNFTLNGDSFYLADGVVGLAVNKGKDLYFTSLASNEIHHVPVRELDLKYTKKPKYVTHKGNVNFRKTALVLLGNHLYFSSLEDNALRRWDIRTKYDKWNTKVIAQSDSVLQFVSGLKAAENSKAVYGFSNKYQRSAVGKRNITEENFHLFIQDL